jgi:Leucine-rich repeat (LRR) protein
MAGYSFIRQNRPDIGLVSFYDLGEIYSSDERDALFNILLDPEGLDQIYNLSRSGLTKEDVRTAGGLDLPVYHSMALSQETSRGISNKIKSLLRTDGEIGDPGLQNFFVPDYSDNIIVLHGGLAANNIKYSYVDEEGEYQETIVPTSRESLFNSVVDTETAKFLEAIYTDRVRIRRRSHINSLKLRANAATLLTNRGTVSESPTHIFKIPTYVRTPSNTSPKCELLECYCTVNSPLILPVRIGTTANLSLSREQGLSEQDSPVSFVYGWELKLRKPPAGSSELPIIKQEIITDSSTRDVEEIKINVTGTEASNKDCLLYIYLDPEQITEIDLSGLGIKEEAGRDIGLIGFNNLESINISGNRLSSLPTWIKTLNEKLIELDISGNDWDENGAIYSVFDYQSMQGSGISGSVDDNAPSKTLSEFMCYSGYLHNGEGSKDQNYKGYSTIQNPDGKLWKDSRKTSIERFKYLYQGNPDGLTEEPIPINLSKQNGFRKFTLLNRLVLGSEIKVVNGDFSQIFPNLFDLSIDSSSGSNPDLVKGLIPKINNTTADQITLDFHGQTNMKGSIGYMGDTPFWTNTIDEIDKGTITTKTAFETAAGVTTSLSEAEILAAPNNFIGRYNIKTANFRGTNVVGGILTGSDDVSGSKVLGVTHLVDSSDVDVVTRAWDSWLKQLSSITFYSHEYGARDLYFRLAKGSSYNWKKLSRININHVHGTDDRYVKYNEGVTTGENSSDNLQGDELGTVLAYDAAWGGKIFSIEGVASTLKILQLGQNRWDGYDADTTDALTKWESSNGYYKYILPKNFVSKENTKLEEIYLHDLNTFYSEDKRLILRSGDLSILQELKLFRCNGSRFFGDFPQLSAKVDAPKIDIYIGYNNFKDLSNLGSDRNQKIVELAASNMSRNFGGCRIPNFSKSSTNMKKLDLTNNLSTKNVDSKVMISCLANLSIEDKPSHLGTLTEEVSTPSATWNTESSSDGKIYRIVVADGDIDISKDVYVNDEIRDGNASGPPIGTVTQIHKSGTKGFIHVAGVDTGFSGKTLAFVRRGQRVDDFFEGFSNLQTLDLQNNRLVGKVPTFKGAKNLTTVNLTDNLFTEWPGDVFTTTGFFSGGTVKLTSFDIRQNPLDVEAIRSIIKELYNSKKANDKLSYSGLKINLQQTKWNGNGYDTNWKKDDVFYSKITKEIDDPSWVPPTKQVDSGEVDEDGNPIFIEVIDTSKSPPKITVVYEDPLLDQYKLLVGDYNLKLSGIVL